MSKHCDPGCTFDKDNKCLFHEDYKQVHYRFHVHESWDNGDTSGELLETFQTLKDAQEYASKQARRYQNTIRVFDSMARYGFTQIWMYGTDGKMRSTEQRERPNYHTLACVEGSDPDCPICR